jgi:hypothetical protein
LEQARAAFLSALHRRSSWLARHQPVGQAQQVPMPPAGGRTASRAAATYRRLSAADSALERRQAHWTGTFNVLVSGTPSVETSPWGTSSGAQQLELSRLSALPWQGCSGFGSCHSIRGDRTCWAWTAIASFCLCKPSDSVPKQQRASPVLVGHTILLKAAAALGDAESSSTPYSSQENLQEQALVGTSAHAEEHICRAAAVPQGPPSSNPEVPQRHVSSGQDTPGRSVIPQCLIARCNRIAATAFPPLSWRPELGCVRSFPNMLLALPGRPSAFLWGQGPSLSASALKPLPYANPNLIGCFGAMT